MAKIKINEERCKGCRLCTVVCPKEILCLGQEINHQGYLYATISEMDRCTGCALCAQMCPDVAIEVWR
jgi:2-oxoglutarate ferredoxin oxidoreductase subunit delta